MTGEGMPFDKKLAKLSKEIGYAQAVQVLEQELPEDFFQSLSTGSLKVLLLTEHQSVSSAALRELIKRFEEDGKFNDWRTVFRNADSEEVRQHALLKMEGACASADDWYILYELTQRKKALSELFRKLGNLSEFVCYHRLYNGMPREKAQIEAKVRELLKTPEDLRSVCQCAINADLGKVISPLVGAMNLGFPAWKELYYHLAGEDFRALVIQKVAPKASFAEWLEILKGRPGDKFIAAKVVEQAISYEACKEVFDAIPRWTRIPEDAREELLLRMISTATTVQEANYALNLTSNARIRSAALDKMQELVSEM